MKLCFSTIGCPDWTWEEIFSTAKDLGMQGIEIRGIGDEIYAPKNKPFLPENLAKTLETLKRVELTIPCLTSGATLSGDSEAAITETKDYIDLAQAIGTPYIRVMIENTPHPSKEIDAAQAREVYQEILDYAADKDVLPLIETNGALADSDAMLEFIKSCNRSNAKVLWDIHHPYRYFNESPQKTFSTLGDLIVHTHVKDSVMENDKVVYKMLGYGDVPLLEAVRALKSGGYNGFISLEWTKRWMPSLEDPGIVFSQFLYMIRNLERQA